MAKLKKLLWINNLGCRHSGAETYIQHVSSILKKNGITQYFLYDPNQEYDARFLKNFDAAFPLISVEQLKKLNPDLIFIQQVRRPETLKIVKESGIPHIAFVHDCLVFLQKEAEYTTYSRKSCYPPSKVKWYFTLLEKLGSFRVRLKYNACKYGLGSKLYKEFSLINNFLVGSTYMREHLESFGISGKITVNPLFCTVKKKYERKPQRGNILFLRSVSSR